MSACVSSLFVHGIKSINIEASVIGEDYWAVISINDRESVFNLNFENKKAFDAFVENNNVTIEGESNE